MSTGQPQGWATSLGSGGSRLARWAAYSVALNIGLVVAHGAVAVSSGSLAVTAELTHNAVDLLSALAVVAGIRIAARRSTRFPYGLHKVENVVAVGLAALIWVSAYEVVSRVLLGPSDPREPSMWMVGVLIVTTALPLLFSHFELRVATAENSPALTADAREYRIHGVTTGSALVALATGWTGLPVDRVAAVGIAAVVVRAGWEVLRDAMGALLDASLDRATLAEVESVAAADPAVRAVAWCTGRNADRYRFVELGAVLRPTQPEQVAVVVARVEAAIRWTVSHVDRVLVHPERPVAPSTRVAVPLDERSGRLSGHFGAAPFFALVDLAGEGDIIRSQVLDNPHAEVEKGRGLQVAEWLVATKVDVVVRREPLRGRAPDHVFGEAGISVHVTDAADLETALRQLSPRRA